MERDQDVFSIVNRLAEGPWTAEAVGAWVLLLAHLRRTGWTGGEIVASKETLAMIMKRPIEGPKFWLPIPGVAFAEKGEKVAVKFDPRLYPRETKRRRDPSPEEHLAGCADCADALLALKKVTGRSYRGSPKTVASLHARIKQYGLEGVRRVIEYRWSRVRSTEWQWTMRPETIFNATKFDGYHAEASAASHDRKAQEPGWIK